MSDAKKVQAEEYEPLWDNRTCSIYLGKSTRWLYIAVRTRPEEPGSIPHSRVGETPRFIPEDIREWVRVGCPPAATFAEWQRVEKKKRTVQPRARNTYSFPPNVVGAYKEKLS